MNSGSKLLIGALAGAATGALVAGLFTTEGEEMRSKLARNTKDLANNMKGKMNDLKNQATDKLHAVQQNSGSLANAAKSQASTVAGAV